MSRCSNCLPSNGKIRRMKHGKIESKNADLRHQSLKKAPNLRIKTLGFSPSPTKKLSRADKVEFTSLELIEGKEDCKLSEPDPPSTCCNGFKAVFRKQYLSYKNSKKYLALDIILPLVVMIFGLWVTNHTYYRSPSRIIEPERMDPNQLILVDRAVTIGRGKSFIR